MSDDRRKRDLELLMKSRKAMEAEQALQAESTNEQEAGDPGEGDDGVVMYRGRPVRRGGNGPKIPGAGSSSKPTSFRGAGGSRKGQTPDIKDVLKRLDELHREGLISKTEYDKKRLQILDRL